MVAEKEFLENVWVRAEEGKVGQELEIPGTNIGVLALPLL